MVISIKKYLEMDFSSSPSGNAEANEMLAALLESYRAALRAISKSGVQACPAVSADLKSRLASLEQALGGEITPKVVKTTERQVEQQLEDWGGRTSEYFKTKANEVKELLIVLAKTAESLAKRDQRYAGRFSDLTTQLQTIANLDDLGQIRSSLVKRAAELKSYVEQMTQDSQKSVAQLEAAVSTYETKLKAVEQLAAQDPLTGLANRRNIEERIEWRISHNQPFSVVVIDIDDFKLVNDNYGHLAGDSLLKQFAQELRANVRGTDLVGRWSGDEFILVLDCDLLTADSQLERLRKWVFGEYTIPMGADKGDAKINVTASLGLAQWQPGQTFQQIIEHADASMYKEKKRAKGQGA